MRAIRLFVSLAAVALLFIVSPYPVLGSDVIMNQFGFMYEDGGFPASDPGDVLFGFPEPTSLGSIDWTAGSKLGEVAPHLSGWTFHADVSTNAATGIPAGYRQNWSCKIVFPESVPVEDTSWGKVKTLYTD